MSGDAPQSHSFSFARVLLVVVPLALVVWWAATMYSKNIEQDQVAKLEDTMLTRLLGEPQAARLAKGYADADSDLVADPPAKDELKDPEELNFSYIATAGDEGGEATWKELVAAIAERTGRKVNFVTYADANEQLRALRNGDLHITAFATGEAQGAVNEAGFVPVACFADEEGQSHYSMKIIVPADSPAKEVKDLAPTEVDGQLKKRRVTFVRPRSNSGCTAAVVVLLKEFGLQPERDYTWGFSFGHENSIKWVAQKKTDAAAVASDILERMIAADEVDGDAVRVIYESDPYPPGVVGYAFNLTPELQTAIRETILGFDWSGSGLETEYGKSGSVKFAPVSYKDDWKSVREINEASGELGGKAEKPAA